MCKCVSKVYLRVTYAHAHYIRHIIVPSDIQQKKRKKKISLYNLVVNYKVFRQITLPWNCLMVLYNIMTLSTQVKSQGYCASSWAFSAAGSVEGQLFKKTGRKGKSLSEQQLIDCSWSYGNAGCNGGHMLYSYRYIMDNEGICTESSYPYLGYVSFHVIISNNH